MEPDTNIPFAFILEKLHELMSFNGENDDKYVELKIFSSGRWKLTSDLAV